MVSYTGSVSSPRDALLLIEAARQELIPTIKKRLSTNERSKIKSGSNFIWNEQIANMKRWTDGKSWSASRVNGPFLTYKEMEPLDSGVGVGLGSGSGSSDITNFKYKNDGLTKQSFSMETDKGGKFHLISYINEKDLNTLINPSIDPLFSGIEIDDNINDKYNNYNDIDYNKYINNNNNINKINNNNNNNNNNKINHKITKPLKLPPLIKKNNDSILNYRNEKLKYLNNHDDKALNILDKWSFK